MPVSDSPTPEREPIKEEWSHRFDNTVESIEVNISDLMGKTIVSISNIKNEELIFTLKGGNYYRMYHDQNCCEGVSIEDIAGDLNDLLDTPITMAVESTNTDNRMGRELDSFTWTFYNLATIKGYVNIRWLGESNGYYSESVTISKVTKK